ncbi:MAG: adenosyl-hopene transferase HpnH, partial [Planctomycetota bacterium]
EGLVARKKFVYLCTNAILLKKKLDEFTPDTRLSFSVHMDGPREEHDRAVCRDGVYDKAIDGIAEAVARGFRVTTNTTVYDDADPAKMHELFDTLTEIGVEGMMVSPGYPYELAPDQGNFLRRERTVELFKEVLDRPKKGWKFNQSPLFLEFLRGNYDLECTPWGNPTYNLFGWQKPCYLLNEGHTESFADLLAQTDATKYGRASGNPKCADCMVHCGYEPTAVSETFGTWRGLWRSAAVTLFGLGPSPARVPMPSVAAGHPVPSPHLPLVSLGLSEASTRETTPA